MDDAATLATHATTATGAALVCAAVARANMDIVAVLSSLLDSHRLEVVYHAARLAANLLLHVQNSPMSIGLAEEILCRVHREDTRHLVRFELVGALRFAVPLPSQDSPLELYRNASQVVVAV